ncbi:hypothetical protein SKAU_G00083030 [Synaphobranchus kaupii]|uniref:Uncharacterized protein n=1 Tax=Synaphobranchus kaupii TaxID=118154 RepID=A0A9Q1FW16_SYNKA|nr:hypothetical protein SKAU_G00083030 [Synaphobranchus kaupii]
MEAAKGAITNGTEAQWAHSKVMMTIINGISSRSPESVMPDTSAERGTADLSARDQNARLTGSAALWWHTSERHTGHSVTGGQTCSTMKGPRHTTHNREQEISSVAPSVDPFLLALPRPKVARWLSAASLSTPPPPPNRPLPPPEHQGPLQLQLSHYHTDKAAESRQHTDETHSGLHTDALGGEIIQCE